MRLVDDAIDQTGGAVRENRDNVDEGREFATQAFDVLSELRQIGEQSLEICTARVQVGSGDVNILNRRRYELVKELVIEGLNPRRMDLGAILLVAG